MACSCCTKGIEADNQLEVTSDLDIFYGKQITVKCPKDADTGKIGIRMDLLHETFGSVIVISGFTRADDGHGHTAVESFPAGHESHAVAPASTPVFVIDPAIQSVHDATLDTFENFPATHFVHVVAPASLPVIEPAAHTLQNTAAPELWYMPALHSSHEGRLEADCM